MAFRALIPNTVTSPTREPSDRPMPVAPTMSTPPNRLNGRFRQHEPAVGAPMQRYEQDHDNEHERGARIREQLKPGLLLSRWRRL